MSARCPVANCGTQIADDKVMCVRHWTRLPIATQQQIYRSWADTLRTRPVTERVRIVRAHQKLIAEAVRHVNATEEVLP